MKTISYKGATITIEPTTPEYRAKCEMTNDIYYWGNVKNAGVGMVNNSPISNITKWLKYVRKRILKAKKHPKYGW